ncbi:MAG: hypothetical protein K0U36_03845, partial [Alphaproteobacteria bacterium]|nr:hypothetical protein [Alphaproteobacteria bacterium]
MVALVPLVALVSLVSLVSLIIRVVQLLLCFLLVPCLLSSVSLWSGQLFPCIPRYALVQTKP